MTPPCTAEPFAVDGDPPVRGVLHRTGDERADVVVLTHGAGSSHAAPMLIALATAFAAAGVTALRCDLAFRQTRRSGPPTPAGAERDRRGLAAALDAISGGAGRRFVGGHSYGGRQASMLVTESPAAAHGLLLLSYPLHPPGKPQARRVEHFPRLTTPTLFVHGERDPFASIDELDAARTAIPAPTALHVVRGAAHALRTDVATMQAVVTAFLAFVH